ncbi:stationary phase growth adaptation protein [Marinomonas gallaica]|uniref:stationary phase growth adaptation protein n=1 Tax=Marinomonas gallaica TaxID=1806667 RepID=UPI000ACF4631|nr:stationary phase growth adaptation protein [Marinomonas gallaica]
MRKIDEVEAWRPYVDPLDGTVYGLSHLNAHEVTYSTVFKGQTEKYTFIVSYSFHCFAKDYEHQVQEELERLMYHAPNASRPFCVQRYELSKKYLRQIVESLGDKGTYIGHAGFGSYATVSIPIEDGSSMYYFVPFKAYREKKQLRIHITSAYPIDERQKLKKVNFFSIAKNLRQGRQPPKP